jgi:TIR domain-containing protein
MRPARRISVYAPVYAVRRVSGVVVLPRSRAQEVVVARIFISYRRDDDPFAAGRLYDVLSAKFGADQVFMDLDTLEPGEDFWEVIKEALERADVQLALIGRGWLTASDQTGKRRLDAKDDFVRREIALALKGGLRVIPVLINGATMPPANELPSSIKRLTTRNAVQLTAATWRAEVARLVTSLEHEPSLADEPAQAESSSTTPSAPDADELAARLQVPPEVLAEAERASRPPSPFDPPTLLPVAPPQGKRSADELLAMAKSAIEFDPAGSLRRVKPKPQTQAIAAQLAQDEWVLALFPVEDAEIFSRWQGFLAITNKGWLYSSASETGRRPTVTIEWLDRSQVASASLGKDLAGHPTIVIKRHTGTGTTAEWLTIKAPPLTSKAMLEELRKHLSD